MTGDLQASARVVATAVAAVEFTVAGVMDALLATRPNPARLRGLYRVALEVVRHFGAGRRLLVSELQAFLANSPKFRAEIRRAHGSLRPAEPTMQPVFGLLEASLVPAITTVAALADWLGVYDDELLAWTRSLRTDRGVREPRFRSYHYQWLPRRSSPPRLLEVPKQRLKAAQRRIATGILRQAMPHGCAHGFVRGRSVLTGVAAHVGQRCVLRMDLEDCFASIGFGRVLRTFLNHGYPEDVARALALLCTTATPTNELSGLAELRDERTSRLREKLSRRHLPQGAPSSPGLMNLAMYRADARLAGLAQRFSATYSRYADDLLFSGGDAFRRDAERCATYAAAILAGEGLQVAHHKTRSQCHSQAQRSCGLVLNERPTLPRKQREHLEAILHNCVVHGPSSQNRAQVCDFRAHLQGRVAHASRFDRTGKLLRLFAAIDWRR
jgi:RNA-directed DNA polymerase